MAIEGTLVEQDKNLHSPPGSLVGTPVYLAPEVALSSQSGHIYNGQVQLYCLNAHMIDLHMQ